jgi:secreted trypsin-like serine protease
MVGDAKPASGDAQRSTVVIVGSGGNICSGAMIAPTVVLTAAHCIRSGATYRVLNSSSPERYVTANAALNHPKFDPRAIDAHRATADIALLRLPRPAPGRSPTPVRSLRFDQAQSFLVAGGGVSRADSDEGIGTIREANLSVTGKPGALQVRLADPSGRNEKAGLGACTGDSGGPAFQVQDGMTVIVGVIAWSTGPKSGEGCGGLTGITPLTLYLDWCEAPFVRGESFCDAIRYALSVVPIMVALLNAINTR